MKKEDFITTTITVPSETRPAKLIILGQEFDCSNIEELVVKLKALEILKRTELDIEWFIHDYIKEDSNYEVYEMVRKEMGKLGDKIAMTKEEFYLLKEVLK